MKFFTKNEVVGVSVILLLIIIASLYNFRLALRRARDAQRKADLGAIVNGLDKYNTDFGVFPLASSHGKLKACLSEGMSLEDLKEELKAAVDEPGAFFEKLTPCEWGRDALRDVLDSDYPAYLKMIPIDPKADLGFSYIYLSNGKRFQLYAYLEGGEAEDGYRQEIVARKIFCGTQICNYGRAFGGTPLEKSIQEYENELIQEKVPRE